MDKVLTTIAAKQHDYGYDNIAGFGSQGLVVRISDKRARLRNLKKRGAPANEPLLDTWLDIVGYCIVGLMWEAGTFKLPLAADAVNAMDMGRVEPEDPRRGPFDRDDLADIRAIVEDTVVGGNTCNAWVRGVVDEQQLKNAEAIAESIARHSDLIIRKVAREEIEAWHSEARATNASQTEGERTPPRVQHGTVPDLKGRDHPTPPAD
jgi:hypothetical protein